MADFSPEGPQITYRKPDLRHYKPVGRDYVHHAKVVPEPKDLPQNIELPL